LEELKLLLRVELRSDGHGQLVVVQVVFRIAFD
jgi:hypothetical protein